MTAVSDAAAQAVIGAAVGELKLPTVRDQAARLAEIAAGERQTHLAYLVEARVPRLKRLADFNTDAVPCPVPGRLVRTATGAYLKVGEPIELLGDSGTGKTHLLIGLGLAACKRRRRSATSPPPPWSTSSSKPPLSARCPAW